jgi:hypothetical protein
MASLSVALVGLLKRLGNVPGGQSVPYSAERRSLKHRRVAATGRMAAC